MSETGIDRRTSAKQLLKVLKRDLNEAQLETLHDLEKFGWELKFVRRKPFEPPIAVVADGDRKSTAVLEPDGSINEQHGLTIRDD